MTGTEQNRRTNMNRFVYIGDESDKKQGGRNLGRFGFVKPGDTLVLTPRESMSVVGDRRFEEYDPQKHEKITPPNDPKLEEAARIEAIKQMNVEQLRDLAREKGIDFNPRTPGHRLVALIMAKITNPNTPDEAKTGGEE